MDAWSKFCEFWRRAKWLISAQALMLPMLGLYAELYRDRGGVGAEAYSILEPLRDRLFPKEFEYESRRPDGTTAVETSAEKLFIGAESVGR